MILNSIIYARSISIIMVLLFHFSHNFSLGYLELIFFIISGFAIFLAKDQKLKIKIFSYKLLQKRYFRLQPPAIVIILISMIISVFLLVPFCETTFYTGLATFGLANFWLIKFQMIILLLFQI